MKRFVTFLAIIVLLLSCKKPEIISPISTDFGDGLFILNEGLFQQNNASLSFYSFTSKTMTPSVFSSINNRGLGDTANDMIAFIDNGKLYYAIAVNVSSQVEILNGLSLKSEGQIGLFNNGIGREPRSLQYYNGIVYSINFDGTISLIDVETLKVIKTVSIGQNPESSIIYQNHLYAINTGGLNFPNYDSTISVLDLESNAVISEFVGGINESNLIIDDQGDGYMISRGNYSDIKPKLVRLDIENQFVLDRYAINAITMTYENNLIYYYDDIADAIFTFNTETEQKSNAPLIDCSNFENVYKIVISPDPQLIYVVDANGYVNSSIIRIYDLEGKFQLEIQAGLNSNTIVFTP